MLNIYINTSDQIDWKRLSPTGTNVVNNCKFFFDIKDLDTHLIDYFVVFNQINKDIKFLKEINKKNSLLIACEPPSAYFYSQKYASQFEHLICPDVKIKHKNKIKITTFYPWHIGHNRDDGLIDKNIDFKSLFHKKFNKKKKISVIQSNKIFCKEHQIRKKIIDTIVNEFKSEIDVYGEGFQKEIVSDKIDVLADYHYHICIENFFSNDYWTEKLSDPIIARTNPIYLGCQNLKQYFPDNFILLKDNDMNHNLKIVDEILKKNNHEFYFEKSRILLFEKYNLLTFLSNFIEKNLSHETTQIKFYQEKKFKNYKYKILNLYYKFRRLLEILKFNYMIFF
jgi:hypothetical protein